MNPRVADFRSDTITLPTEAMKQAALEAPLGDDVFADDPTVIALQEEAAELLGKEAALFVPSGTMGNNIGIAVSTRPGDEIILMEDAHTYLYEAGGSARLWGVQARPLPARDGCLDPEQVEAAIRSDDPHHPRTSLVLLENTHNMQGGRVVSPERMEAVAAVCRRHGLALHLDGARLFNAVVASGRPATDFTASVDTVSVCFSKGLSCPVGSIVAGSREHIAEGVRVRKLLGGGMRQVGVIAACCRVALAEGIERLAEDHDHVRRLAEGLRGLDGVTLAPDPPETNILFVGVEGYGPAEYGALQTRLESGGVRALAVGTRGIRFVAHRGVTAPDVDTAIRVFQETYKHSG